jgi:hypothetical protein
VIDLSMAPNRPLGQTAGMHTATELKPGMFDVCLNGAPGGWAEVFPGWNRHDRFGIVVTEPFGALGASLLIQLAVLAFYEVLPERRATPPRYPEIYLFHAGGRFGDFNAFDFWPPRKEVFLPADPAAVLEALNDYAITRLAVPDGSPVPATFAHKEPAAAIERIRSCFAYRADGRPADADITLRACDPLLHKYADATLNPAAVLATARDSPIPREPTRRRDRLRWLAQLEARTHEVSPEAVARQQSLCVTIRHEGVACEGLRRLEVKEALKRLS